jgi:O-antigen ligase
MNAGLAEASLLAAVVLGPLMFGAVEGWASLILLVLTGAALTFRPPERLTGPLHRFWLAGALVVVVLGFLQWASPRPIDAPRTWLPFTSSPPETAKALGLWLLLLAAAAVGPGVFARRDGGRRFVWALLAVGFLISVIGLTQASQGNALMYGIRKIPPNRSAFGPYFNRNHAAGLLAMVIPAGLGLLLSILFGRKKSDEDADDSRLAKAALCGFLLLVCGGAFVAIGSRGAPLGLGLSCALVGWLALGFLKTRRAVFAGRAALAALALAGGLAAASALKPRLPELLHVDNSVGQRVMMTRGGWAIARDFPLWGTGLGTVLSVYAGYKDPRLPYEIDHIHNDWLELAMGSGIAGFLAFALGTLLYFRAALAAWLRRRSARRRLLGAGLAAGALSFPLHGLVDFNFQMPANALIFVLLLAVLQGAVADGPQPEEAPAPAAARRAVFGLACALAAIWGVPGAAAERLYLQKDNDGAYAWSPDNRYAYLKAQDALKQGRPAEALALAREWRAKAPYRWEFLTLERQALAALGPAGAL